MTPADNSINTQPDLKCSEDQKDDSPPIIYHRLKTWRLAFLALLAAWVIAYFNSYGHHLTGDILLTIQMIPAAVIFGGMLLPSNMFRVITGAEPSESIVWPLIIAYWLILIPLQFAYLWSKRSLILAVILSILLISTHGCYQWVNYDSW